MRSFGRDIFEVLFSLQKLDISDAHARNTSTCGSTPILADRRVSSDRQGYRRRIGPESQEIVQRRAAGFRRQVLFQIDSEWRRDRVVRDRSRWRDSGPAGSDTGVNGRLKKACPGKADPLFRDIFRFSKVKPVAAGANPSLSAARALDFRPRRASAGSTSRALPPTWGLCGQRRRRGGAQRSGASTSAACAIPSSSGGI